MKKTFFLTLGFLLLYSLIHAQTMYVKSVDGLRIRSVPRLEASSIGVIPYGEEVRILTQSDDYFNPWIEIRWKNLTGWVYGFFLTSFQIESSSAISEVIPQEEDLLGGVWYHFHGDDFEPFCLEEEKFSEDTFNTRYSFSTVKFRSRERYSYSSCEGGIEGTWTLTGNQIVIDAEDVGGYEDIERYTQVWDISLYRIRSDWLVMEVMYWDTDMNNEPFLRVMFLIKPFSSSARDKIDTYFEEAEELYY
jgi:hypothetical protein